MISLDDLLSGSVALLPQTRPSSKGFQDFIDERVTDYLAEMNRLGARQPEQAVLARRADVAALGAALRDVLTTYLAGDPSGAFDKFEQALAPLSADLAALDATADPTRQIGTFYRIQCSSDPMYPDRLRLFHPPFELRHKVATNRYSIPGTPCLYLGSSAYVCWEELGRPPLTTCYVMALKLTAAASILNLAYKPEHLADLVPIWRNGGPSAPRVAALVTAGAVLWPLILGCSTPVRDRGPFVVEYVLPQLLLQWVKKHSPWVGVRFFSSRLLPYDGIALGANLAFPAQTQPPLGHCPTLRGMFDASPAWNWELLIASNPTGGKALSSGSIQPVPGSGVTYQQTQFSHVETLLDGQPFQPL